MLKKINQLFEHDGAKILFAAFLDIIITAILLYWFGFKIYT